MENSTTGCPRNWKEQRTFRGTCTPLQLSCPFIYLSSRLFPLGLHYPYLFLIPSLYPTTSFLSSLSFLLTSSPPVPSHSFSPSVYFPLLPSFHIPFSFPWRAGEMACCRHCSCYKDEFQYQSSSEHFSETVNNVTEHVWFNHIRQVAPLFNTWFPGPREGPAYRQRIDRFIWDQHTDRPRYRLL